MQEDNQRKSYIGKNKVILVVDDDPGLVLVVAEYLQMLGYSVLSAFNGKEGFKLAKRKRPGMIILDIMMPRMNGFQMLEKIKKDRATMEIPVLMLTAKTEEKDKMKAFQLYAEEYITKPFELDELKKKVEAIFKRRKSLFLA